MVDIGVGLIIKKQVDHEFLFFTLRCVHISGLSYAFKEAGLDLNLEQVVVNINANEASFPLADILPTKSTYLASRKHSLTFLNTNRT